MSELNKTQIAGILLATSLVWRKYGNHLTKSWKKFIQHENINVLAIVSLLLISTQNMQLSILLGIIYLMGMLHAKTGKNQENFAPYQSDAVNTMKITGSNMIQNADDENFMDVPRVSQLPLLSEKFIKDRKSEKICQFLNTPDYFNIDENYLSTNQTHSSYHTWN